MTLNKIIELDEISGLIPEAATVAIGGSWFANHPMAAVRQLVRARRNDLHAIALLGSIDVDLLIGAGVLRHLTFSMVTMEAFGLSAQLRRSVEAGELPITEVPALSLQVALEAAGNDVPFLPLRGPVGSDLVSMHPELFARVRSPFDDDQDVLAVRAVRPDVAVLHATRCDRAGNVQCDGTYGQDVELARAADQVIVTCEEIVPTELIERDPHRTTIPGFLVDAVAEAPFGAHPTSHVPAYAMDAWKILDYQNAAIGDARQYGQILEEIAEENEQQYRARVIGERAPVLRALADSGRTLTPAAAE